METFGQQSELGTGPNQLIIRRATLDDGPAILDAQRASIASLCIGHYTAEQLQSWLTHRPLADYHLGVQNALVLVAQRGAQLAGFTQIDLISGLLHAHYVQPQYVGQGVGRSLLRVLEAEARAAGLRRIHLQATLNSVPFYQGRGFFILRNASTSLADGTELPSIEMERWL